MPRRRSTFSSFDDESYSNSTYSDWDPASASGGGVDPSTQKPIASTATKSTGSASEQAYAGAGLGVLSGIFNAQAARLQGNAEQASAEANASSDEANIGYTKHEYEVNSARDRSNTAKTLGDMRASYGATGLSSDGSGADIIAESARNAELDALNSKYTADFKSTQLQNDATAQRAKGNYAQRVSKARQVASYIGSAESIAKLFI